MGEKKILLSISMLISGREEMAKSLESLHYFTEAFPCEIILVDTGCNEQQRALAERYADKIIDYEWNGDFAAARNAGVRAAKGEWFMYLDDDEWFDDPKEIVAFFTTKEHQKYNCATYVVRSYTEFDGLTYDDTHPSRMCRLEPKTCFIGKVHEFLSTFKAPKRVFSDFVHHYGYVYKNEEERVKHAERNIAPLLEMVEQHPQDPRWTTQLAQEYFSLKQYEKTLKTAEDWMNLRDATKEEIICSPPILGCLYGFVLISLHSMERCEEAEKWLERAFQDPLMKLDFMEPTRAFFYLVGARLYRMMKQDEKCREYTARYMEDYRRLKDDADAIAAGAELIASTAFQETLFTGTMLTVIDALIRLEDFDLARELFYTVDWKDKRLQRQMQTERNMLEAMCGVPFHPLWVEFLQTLVSREEGMKEMLVVFLDVEINFKDLGETQKLSRLRKLAAQLDYSHSYILCAKMLWAVEDPELAPGARKERVEELFGQLVTKYTQEIPRIRLEVWKAVQETGLSVGSYLRDVDFTAWKRGWETWCEEASASEIQTWDERVASWGMEEGNLYDFFLVKCLEGYLRHSEEGQYGMEKLEELFRKYEETAIRIWGPCYRESVFAQIPEVLPDDFRLVLRLRQLRECREQRDDLKALEAARKCLGVYPVLDGAVGCYARLLKDDVEQREREAAAARQDLLKIVEALKGRARMELERGSIGTAREILLQIRRCAPEDEEAARLLEQAEAL